MYNKNSKKKEFAYVKRQSQYPEDVRCDSALNENR